jgi:epoxyqueuosine reductase
VIPIQRSSGLKRVEEEKDTPGGLDLARLYRLPVSASSSDNLSQSLRQRALDEGFAVAGIAAVPGSSRLALRSAALERWLDAGYQGSMAWMADPRRRAINELLPGVRSVLAVGLNYHVKAQRQPGSLAVARYGWGRDYHRVIDGRLRRLGRWLQDQVEGASWRTCVDSGPLMDKAWAEEAGLGWIGKHGNLINPKHGSWLLLGHLLTTVPLSPDRPAPARCGTCRLCIAACPTEAIREPFVVDSRRCISFHTIENRDPVLPPAIANHLQGWVAGCDICQDVCPWNRPDLPSATDPEVQPRPWLLDLQGDQALAWSDGDWDEHLRASALRRIKPWMWRRNLRAALGLSPPSA